MSFRTQIFDLNIQIEGNPVVHVFTSDIKNCTQKETTLLKTLATELTSETGEVAVIVKSKKTTGYGFYKTVFVDTEQKPKCIKSPILDKENFLTTYKFMRETWKTDITLMKGAGGFRDAQKGALFAIFSHWTRGNLPATVVMPTGTGKTETLLATINASSPKRSLVIVPSDALRTQFFEKACEWGRLKSLKVADQQMAYPVVGMLRKGFKSTEGLQEFISRSEIIVATMPILAAMSAEALNYISETCDFVAIDEAHHMAAPSWTRVINTFHNSKILQFTATPFREDGRHIGGDIIYTYPLSRCQEEGFFRPIEFLPITEYFGDKIDRAICDKAIERLRADLNAGYNHALMARTASKERAKIVFEIYRDKCADLNPVLLYSSMNDSEKEASKKSLLSGNSKIVVCVDMLGEGFDYPPLKIAAIHDPHKSLPITLQFIGRFTRSGEGTIGNASVVANIADHKMQSNISALYSQDANWNRLIKGSYEEAINREIDFQEFINGFVFDGISGFSLRNIHPKFSSYIYSLAEDVDFEKLKLSFNDGTKYRMALNSEKHFAVIVQKENERVEWGNILELENTNFHCFCMFHDVEKKLLFIYTSNKEIPDHLVRIASQNATRISDQRIYRCLNNINRLMITNFGLKQRLAGPIRYRQYIGLDVGQGLKDRITENSYAAMLFGAGYENAERAGVGCSLKGKIWSRDAGSLVEWASWCSHIGAKVTDNSIDAEAIFSGVLFPEQIDALPADRTITVVDWADFIFENMYERVSVLTNGHRYSIDECDIRFVKSEEVTISFLLEYPDGQTLYELELSRKVPEGFLLRSIDTDVLFLIGKETVTGVDFFKNNPPMFWFDDASVLIEGCLYIKASRHGAVGVYDATTARVFDWSSTDIHVESQGKEKRTESIQYAMILDARHDEPLVIFDDDGSGEIADIVAIYDRGNDLLVRLYHCKYAAHDKAGIRITDAYEICGQAQKSVKWAGSIKDFADQMRRREKRRLESGGNTRFEKGGIQEMNTILMMSQQKKVKFEAVLVHPGISHAGLMLGDNSARNMLRVLAATASYLLETFEIDMKLIVNA